MVGRYPKWIEDCASLVRTGNPDERTSRLFTLVSHVVARAQQLEEWFGRSATQSIPATLFAGVERGCRELDLPNRFAVLAVGRADNLETLLDDLTGAFFGALEAGFEIPEGLPLNEFAMLQVPRLEGSIGLWWPLILGHEIAHLKCEYGSAESFDVLSRINWAASGGSSASRTDRLRRKFENYVVRWANELLCDAFTVFRFGPAAVASLTQFLDINSDISQISQSHPPGLLRIVMARRWLEGTVAPALESMLETSAEISEQSFDAAFRGRSTDWRDFVSLLHAMAALGDELMDEVAGWPKTVDGVPVRQRYDSTLRQSILERCISDIGKGVPPMEQYLLDGNLENTTPEDVVNAGWASRSAGSDELVSKSLDTLEFVQRWRSRGGKLQAAAPEGVPPVAITGGILPKATILSRLNRSGDPRLVVTPALDSFNSAALDVHLSSKFIVFRRSLTPSVRTADDFDPQRMQELIEVSWGEAFTLHPNETVLGATLEYFSFPLDIAAQVVTRSSYGRLGMITATAVQVHPGFQGCLTLELLNLGQIPLQLTPGERIAQLIFVGVQPAAEEPDSTAFHYAIGPQFSRGRVTDAERLILINVTDKVAPATGPADLTPPT
jgi:deoxycytidine triphosphate deaminase